MREIAGSRLWLGHAGDLREPRQLLAAGVEAVVELADNEAYNPLPRELVRCRFPLSDGGDNPTWLLRLAVHTLAELLRFDVPTIVCCSCGMNRSVCVAAGAMAVLREQSLDKAIVAISSGGAVDVSPALFAQLREALQP